MATPPLSEGTLRDSLRAVRTEGSQNKAAKELGISRNTLQHRLKLAAERGVKDDNVEFPEFVTEGDEDETDDELRSRLRKAYERRQKAEQARRWFPIKIGETLPYGILWFGDPHITSGDFPLLERHIEIARRPGIYGANIGDTSDNWPWTGRMARLWAETDTSNKTERAAAEWFMFRSGVSWLVWLLGNHDLWNAGDDFYKRLGAHRVPVIDWRAQFRLIHRSGAETRIDAAHGRKGTSIYNPTHGTLKDAKFGEDCDAYITGHTHNFGLFEIEFPERKSKAWLAQISGYKRIDLHAKVNGFAPAQFGASVLQIIWPDTGKTVFFSDVEQGADYLAWLRKS